MCYERRSVGLPCPACYRKKVNIQINFWKRKISTQKYELRIVICTKVLWYSSTHKGQPWGKSCLVFGCYTHRPCLESLHSLCLHPWIKEDLVSNSVQGTGTGLTCKLWSSRLRQIRAVSQTAAWSNPDWSQGLREQLTRVHNQ